MSSASWAFVLVAAGRGSRLGGIPKQFRFLRGKPLWLWSFLVGLELYKSREIQRLVVVVPSEKVQDMAEYLKTFSVNCVVVPGGESRSDSVCQGVAAAEEEYVLVHDGARPFLSLRLCREIMDRVVAHKEEKGGCVPVLSCVDAMKEVSPEGVVTACPGRSSLRCTQTPQGFPRKGLEALLRTSPCLFDEGEMWHRAGYPLYVVEGEFHNFKITYEADWERARFLVGEREPMRTGHGFDIHPLVPSRPLILGGVSIESPLGLGGYSDADVITHAVCDALLGAAGMEDLGTLFPAGDAQYKNIHSLFLLEKVVQRLGAEDWRICWVDITLHAQYPRLNKYKKDIITNLNRVLSKDATIICNLKMKSGERCGSVGRGECMECYALATLAKEAPGLYVS